MLKLSAILSAIMFVFSVIMNYDSDANKKDSGDTGFTSIFFYRATLSNRELSNNRSWFHVLMVAVITFITIYIIR